MIVLHVLSGLHAGGIEQLALQLLSHAPPGQEPHLLNTDRRYQELRPAFEALVGQGRLRLTDWPASDGPLLAWRSLQLCRRLRPAALLIYPFQRPMLWLALGARLAGVRRLAVHLGNPAPADRCGRRTWRLLLQWFGLLGVIPVPCSAAIVESLAPLPPGLRLGPVIPNGCDTLAIAARAAVARSARPPGDPHRLLMVARLDPIKDQATLLRAFAALGPERQGWELQLVGEGSERPRLEALAVQLGLDPAQVLPGRRIDIPELLGQSDVFAFSTTPAEGFGIALIEALAAGLPVIASDVPACREVLVLFDGAAGDLLPPGDEAAWAARLAELMGSPVQRQELAERAESHAAVYDIRHTAESWYRLLGLATDPI